MTKICMIDMETLGQVAATCGALTLGGVVIDTAQNLYTELDFFFNRFNLQEQLDHYRTEAGTLRYHFDLPPEIGKANFAKEDELPEHDVLKNFAQWFQQHNPDEIWSLGADFDITILGRRYGKFFMEIPWGYRKARCFRTIREMCKHIQTPFTNLASHNALSDARYQAQCLHTWLKHIKID